VVTTEKLHTHTHTHIFKMKTDNRGNTSGQNCHKRECRRDSKYKSLRRKIQRTWNIKRMIMPVITGDIGMVTTDLKKFWEP
jgi:hypothetical protein